MPAAVEPLEVYSYEIPNLIRSNFIKTTYDISLDSQISFLALGFSSPAP